MADNFNKGTFGEQGAGFFFGSQGYFLVEGPSGTQEPGHAANAPGFDGVAYNVKTDHLIIYVHGAAATAASPVVGIRTSGCVGRYAFSKIMRLRWYSVSAVAYCPVVIKNKARLERARATSGCVGPRAFSKMVTLRRYSGSALANCPVCRYTSARLLRAAPTLAWVGRAPFQRWRVYGSAV